MTASLCTRALFLAPSLRRQLILLHVSLVLAAVLVAHVAVVRTDVRIIPPDVSSPYILADPGDTNDTIPWLHEIVALVVVS